MAASLTVTRSVTEIQNLLVCAVCKKIINEPKILSCSHSFCKACLENLTTQDEENVDGEGKCKLQVAISLDFHKLHSIELSQKTCCNLLTTCMESVKSTTCSKSVGFLVV